MEVRIGVIHSPREMEIELGDDTDAEGLTKDVEAALAAPDGVLWLTDRRGRRIGVPASKVAYIEIGGKDDRRVGFGLG